MANKATKKDSRNRERITLPNGCQYTHPYISPANWESSKASVKKPWFIRFIYYDPVRRPNGKELKWEGMNSHKTLAARQDASRQLLADTLADLKNGVNPVLKPKDRKIPAAVEPIPAECLIMDSLSAVDSFLTPESSLADCLKWAYDQYDDETGTKKDMRSYMHHVNPALVVLQYNRLPVKDITPQHILRILVYLAGPFFTYAERWLIDQIRSALKGIGLSVFSPWHDIGHGIASDVVIKDLEGLEESKLVFAVIDGLDSGTLFEVGYAVKKNIPVIAYVENETKESIKMLEGTGCILEKDLTTAIYKSFWLLAENE